MHSDLILRDIQCPAGSTFQVCGPKATWSGCCSVNDCDFSDGVCPTNADISISIDQSSPQTTFFESTPKATSGVGPPVTAGGSKPSTGADTTTDTDSQTVIITTLVGTSPYTTTDVFTLTEPLIGGGGFPSGTFLTITVGTETSSLSVNSVATTNSATTGTAIIATSTGSPTTKPITSQTSSSGNTAATGTPSNDTGSSVLSGGAIGGVAVGGILGVAGLSLIVFMLCRHRRHARRMSSFRDGLRDEYLDKDTATGTQASEGRNDGDVFAPFGGRINSIRAPNPPQTISPSALLGIGSRQSTASNLVSPSSPGAAYGHESMVSPTSPRGTSMTLPTESTQGSILNVEPQPKPQEPPMLDSKPVYFELDSATTAKFNVAELPASSSQRASQITRRGSNDDAQSIHPESLRPGSTPNVVKDVQRQRLIRVNSGEAAVVSVGNKPQQQQQHVRHGSLDDVPRIRATMNATDDDVKTNRHVNSWTRL